MMLDWVAKLETIFIGRIRVMLKIRMKTFVEIRNTVVFYARWKNLKTVVGRVTAFCKTLWNMAKTYDVKRKMLQNICEDVFFEVQNITKVVGEV